MQIFFRSTALWFGFIFFGLLLSCHTIWNYPEKDFLTRLQNQNLDFLKTVDFNQSNPQELHRLGEGAWYCLAQHFLSLGMQENAKTCLWAEWTKGSQPWKESAAQTLYPLYLAAEQFALAEKLAEKMHLLYPEKSDYWFFYVKALYKQQKNAQVLELLSVPVQDLTEIQKQEIVLIRAVTLARSAQPDWQLLLRELFFNFPASELHPRAWEFIQNEPLCKDAFSPEEINIFRFKRLAAFRKWSESEDLASKILLQPGEKTLLSPLLLKELLMSYSYQKKYALGLDMLLQRKKLYPDTHALTLLEMQAAFYRKLSRYSEAVQLYTQLLLQKPNNQDFLWLLLDCSLEISSNTGSECLEKNALKITDKQSFSGLLSDLCFKLVEEKKWETLFKLIPSIEQCGIPLNIQQFLFIAWFSASQNLWEIKASELEALKERLLLFCQNQKALTYYSLLTLLLLGKDADLQQYLYSDTNTSAQAMTDNSQTRQISRLLHFGLYRYAYEELSKNFRAFDPDFLCQTGKIYSEKNQYYFSISVIQLYTILSRKLPNLKNIPYLYPWAYLTFIREHANKYKIPLPLFYGLVREESFFQPDIVSSSGAVGLCQLLPGTAEETAQSLKWSSYNLRNPADNCALGAAYYAKLYAKLKNHLYALVAYNGGARNVANWLKNKSSYHPILRLEAFPFYESRHYIRKIMVSSVYYGLLNNTYTPRQIVQLFFPDLF